MKQFTDAEFAALTTEQKQELKEKFCVYNDGSQRFKDTVVRFLNQFETNLFAGTTKDEYYHYPRYSTDVVLITAHHPILTIDQFCELFPEYSDVNKLQLSTEQIEAIAKSVVAIITSDDGIKGDDGVEYVVSLMKKPEKSKDNYEHLVGKWVRCTNVDKGWTKDIQVNKWYQVIETETSVHYRLNFGNCWGKYSFFDLDNPLDYNPETLVGKYYEGNRIEGICFPKDKPCFHMNRTALGFYCSDIDLFKVTDAPPTPEPSYKLEDIVEIVKPAYYLLPKGVVSSSQKNYKDPKQFPKESQGKQVAALCQLFTLMEWANEGRERKEGESVWQPCYIMDKIRWIKTSHQHSPIYLFDLDKARKLVETNEQVFKDFLGV